MRIGMAAAVASGAILLASVALAGNPPQNKTDSPPLQAKSAGDPHRPQYHLLPPVNWMGGPSGLIPWKGQYHLFFQHNPNGAARGSVHWGHAVSDDLLHWRNLPIALAPTPDGPDRDGCLSGCVVDNNGTPTLFYTGMPGEVQCIATSNDGMVRWRKHPGNPVISSPPKELKVTGLRDPWVWREGDTWYMIIGSGVKDVGGMALLYQSRDLARWQYLHPLFVGDKDKTGWMWECPNFFPLGDKHVLLVSALPMRKAYYFIGQYADHKFTPQTQGVLDFGEYFYAPQTCLDGKGRRILFGGLSEGRSEREQGTAGWAGVLSLPRLLSVLPDGTLGMEPLPELQTLRSKHYRFRRLPLTAGASPRIHGVNSERVEILARFDPAEAKEFGVKVHCSPDDTEETVIAYDRAAKRLTVDRGRSPLDPEAERGVQGGTVEIADGELLVLDIFVDRSVVEVFANGRACITSRVYPHREKSFGIKVFANGGDAKLMTIEIWQMPSIGETTD